MTEDEARLGIYHEFGQVGVDRCARILDFVLKEGSHQNLISASTVRHAWARHLADSAQLIRYGPPSGRWVDIGTGAGFPGLVVAALRPQPTTLVEPRRRRAAFLQFVADQLRLDWVTIEARQAGDVAVKGDVLSARAVGTVAKILGIAIHLAAPSAVWILPKGTKADHEVMVAQGDWAGVFHVKPSVTSAESSIVLAQQVRRL